MYTLESKPTAEILENDISRLELSDDLYIVDASRGYAVIAGRSAEARFGSGEDFRDSLMPEESEALGNYLMSFEKRPMLLRTDGGNALIYADTFPSTLMFLVCYPSFGRICGLSDISVLCGNLGIFVPPIYGVGEHAARADKKTAVELSRSMRAIERAFKSNEAAIAADGVYAADSLWKTVANTAELAGCGVRLECPSDIRLGDYFEGNLFKIFLTLFFMLAREHGRRRHAEIRLLNSFEGLAVRAECEIDSGRQYKMMPLANTVSSLAERYNIRCSCAFSENSVSAEICPVRKDWSLLELKNFFGFDWKG